MWRCIPTRAYGCPASLSFCLPQGAVRGGALRPKTKDQGLWLSVIMSSYAMLRLYDKRLWEEVGGCGVEVWEAGVGGSGLQCGRLVWGEVDCSVGGWW